MVSGCASLSSLLGITHSDTVTAKAYILIVNMEQSYDEILSMFSDVDVQLAGTNITSIGDGFFSSRDTADETQTFVFFEPYSQARCLDAEIGTFFEDLNKEPDFEINVIWFDQDLVAACKRKQQGTIGLVTGNGFQIGNPFVSLAFEVEITQKIQYKYIRSGSHCRDGTLSSSIGQGTCSWHDGVVGPAYRRVYLN